MFKCSSITDYWNQSQHLENPFDQNPAILSPKQLSKKKTSKEVLPHLNKDRRNQSRKKFNCLSTFSHKVYNKTWNRIQIPQDLTFPVYHGMYFLGLSPFVQFGVFLGYLFIYLKKSQHNTIKHRESKVLVPNTTPPLALSLVRANIPSEAFLHIPASQERRALPLQSSQPLDKQFFHSGHLHRQHLSPGTQPLQPVLAKVLFRNCPTPLPNFHTRYHVCTKKKDYAIFNKQKAMQQSTFSAFPTIVQAEGITNNCIFLHLHHQQVRHALKQCLLANFLLSSIVQSTYLLENHSQIAC